MVTKTKNAKVYKKILEQDKSDPIKWAQPRVVGTTVIFKPSNHPRARDIATFRNIPSLVTGGRP